MLFFHKKNPPARPADLNWYWTLTVDGMPAADFDWPDLLRGLDRLRPDRDSYVALERMDPNDPREAGFLQCTATPEGPRRSAPRSRPYTGRRGPISPAFPTCPTPSGRTDREVIP